MSSLLSPIALGNNTPTNSLMATVPLASSSNAANIESTILVIVSLFPFLTLPMSSTKLNCLPKKAKNAKVERENGEKE